MEILSANYNCRNPFVAGYLPILDAKSEDQLNRSNKSKSDKNLHLLITTSQTNLKLSACSSLSSTQPTTIYQIDVSTVCTPGIRQLKLTESSSRPANGSNESGPTVKSKKALKNKRRKEAKRKRKNQRHVHFPEEEKRIAIIFVVEEDEYVKEYRNKYWEIFAIDRNRFQNRVQKLAKVLEKVLVPEHRAKIYKERFASETDASEASVTDPPETDTCKADEEHKDGSTERVLKINFEKEESQPERLLKIDFENEKAPAERLLEINFENSDDDLVDLNAGQMSRPCLIEFRI